MMPLPPHITLTHLGGEQTVTGSCHLVQAGGANLLVDCGAFQGRDEVLPMDAWPVRPAEIHALFLTHAHADHIGRVPELVDKGFKGNIVCSSPTRALLAPMLRDTMGLNDSGIADPEQILYRIGALARGSEYRRELPLLAGIRYSLWQAGHILGSCSVHLSFPAPEAGGRFTILFSGDIGQRGTPLLPDPASPPHADLVLLESTYGNRLHAKREERRAELGRILRQALADGGKVFIPAFALGRTQELLYELDRLWAEDPSFQGKAPAPVIIDSPLGLEITKVYQSLATAWDEEARGLLQAGDNPIDFERLYSAATSREHRDLLALKGAAIIIAGSGMCTGGRILDHLRQGLPDPKNDILFIGHQSRGTLGWHIQNADQGERLSIQGESVVVRAKAHILSGFSAHADQAGLLAWLQSMPEKPGCVKLVHGEEDARAALAGELRKRGYPVA